MPEVAFTENVSSHGARVHTKTRLEEGQELHVSSIAGNLRADARVVYCRPLPSRAYVAGLELRDASGQWLLHATPELKEPSKNRPT